MFLWLLVGGFIVEVVGKYIFININIIFLFILCRERVLSGYVEIFVY